MVSITPQGSIDFCSKGFGGHSTDVEILRQSGFVKYVKEGDKLMADRGFLRQNFRGSFLMRENTLREE